MGDANYNGRQPNNTSYIKSFVEGSSPNLWTVGNYLNTYVLQPAIPTVDSVYIPGNLYVKGNIININNINDINNEKKGIDINYLEIIPLLLTKIENMQKELDLLKEEFSVYREEQNQEKW